jgi:peptide/nickel transport system ATP-binding protein
MTHAQPLLTIERLCKHFPKTGRAFARGGIVRSVDGVDLDLMEGETLALVGESGSGKTTLGRCIVRLLDPTSGAMTYRPRENGAIDLAIISGEELRAARREVRMIFQDPRSSLNPRMRVIDIVGEPLRVNGIAQGPALRDRVIALLGMVGLRSEYLGRYPHEFSGGERQRIGIARALALDPRLVIADEAVSALDVSVQAQILNLLQELQRRLSLTYLFIAHDLSVVEHISDRVAVMYVGHIVEIAPTEILYARPRHPYTEALLSAVPRLRRDGERIIMRGEIADPGNPPPGCPFHSRCRYARDICRSETPALRDMPGGGRAACHFADELELRGAYDA